MKEIIELSDKTKNLKRGEFLNSKGILDTNIYYIESGSIRVFVSDNNYDEQIIRFGYQGNLITALDSYLTNKPSAYNMQAIKKTTVRVIPKSKMDSFLNSENNRSIWINILENLVLQQLEREIDILIVSPKERYERVLKRSPNLFQEVPHRYIANYLKMTPETLSRLKKS